MANNRIYLRCKVCGKLLYLGKHFMTPYYWDNYSQEEKHLEDSLNDFFEDHHYCSVCERDSNKSDIEYIDKPLPSIEDAEKIPFDEVFEVVCEFMEKYSNK